MSGSAPSVASCYMLVEAFARIDTEQIAPLSRPIRPSGHPGRDGRARISESPRNRHETPKRRAVSTP